MPICCPTEYIDPKPLENTFHNYIVLHKVLDHVDAVDPVLIDAYTLRIPHGLCTCNHV